MYDFVPGLRPNAIRTIDWRQGAGDRGLEWKFEQIRKLDEHYSLIMTDIYTEFCDLKENEKIQDRIPMFLTISNKGILM